MQGLARWTVALVAGAMVGGCVPRTDDGGSKGDQGPKEVFPAPQNTAGFTFDLGEMAARKTQEEIEAGEHVRVSGEVRGECGGTIRVDVIEPGRSPDDPDGGERPLTTVDLAAPGPFTVLVPTEVKLAIGAACDGDGDGVIGSAADGFFFPMEIGKLWADHDGVVLALAPLPSPSSPPVPAGGELPPDKARPGARPSKGAPAEATPPPPGEQGPPPPGKGTPPPAGGEGGDPPPADGSAPATSG